MMAAKRTRFYDLQNKVVKVQKPLDSGRKEGRMGDRNGIYNNGLLLGVFFDSTNNETNHLYVSFDGLTFRKIGIPYIDVDAGKDEKDRGDRTAFRDPGMMYYNGKVWILNGDLVNKYDNTKANLYQPKWGVSENLREWSPIMYGNSLTMICKVNNQNKYPYDKNGQLNNTKFDAWAPDVFVDIDGDKEKGIYMFLSAGYWGESHGGKSEDDVMKQYLIKVNNLNLNGSVKNGRLEVNYETPKMLNFPEEEIKNDERRIKRGGKEDRIDASLLKGDGGYYFAVKRYGTSYELWWIEDLNQVSDTSKWNLINSDFVYEYEGASLVKFKEKYLFYCDKLSDEHGIHVAVTDRLDNKWKVPEAVKFVESRGAQPTTISRRHGTVLHIKDEHLIDAILSIYESNKLDNKENKYYYGPAKDEDLPFDLSKGWFRSNGKLYNRDNWSERKSCEYLENGNWYWFDSDGSMAKNKFVYIPDHDKWVYYTHTGNMAKGELFIGNEHNYYDNTPESGYHWHYFELDTGEHAVSKFVYLKNGDKWVYYDSHGWMVYGEQKINNNWYYFYPGTGAMAKGDVTLPDGRRYHYDLITGIRGEQLQ